MSISLHIQRLILSTAAIIMFAGSSAVAENNRTSKYSAKILHQIASELASRRSAGKDQIDHAMTFLSAARDLDQESNYIRESILELSISLHNDRFDDIIKDSFIAYADQKADLEITRKAVLHFLDDLHSSELRRDKLSELSSLAGIRNLFLKSELSTQMGLLAIEKAEFETAEKLFSQAWGDNPYNFHAFEALEKVASMTQKTLTPEMYAKHLYLQMIANPADLEKSLGFADFAARTGMHDIACQAYSYSAKLFKYINNSSELPSEIYLPWALSAYNSQNSQPDIFEILKMLRHTGDFDLALESIAGLTLLKQSYMKNALDLLSAAGVLAESTFNKSSGSTRPVTPSQLAWFYSFVLPDSKKAMAWANKAYSEDPVSDEVKSVLAFALTNREPQNGETELANELVLSLLNTNDSAPLYETNQIAAIAMANLLIKTGKPDQAAEKLRKALEMAPYSIEAEKAIDTLTLIGRKYKHQNQGSAIAESLVKDFGSKIIPDFMPLKKLISASLDVEKQNIDFGEDIIADLTIKNNGSKPMIISDAGFLKGYIRVDAKITGDINIEIPELISKRFRPSIPVDQSQKAVVPLKITNGILRRILTSCPQADLNIEFVVYLDPSIDRNGNISSFFPPVKANVQRPATRITNKMLMKKLRDIASDDTAKQIMANKLFAGLYNEQTEKTGVKRTYEQIPVAKKFLTNILTRSVSDEKEIVCISGLYSMLNFNPPIDFELTRAASRNLDHDSWPIRMVSMYLLNRLEGGNFKKVIKWKAVNDHNPNVRNLAAELIK